MQRKRFGPAFPQSKNLSTRVKTEVPDSGVYPVNKDFCEANLIKFQFSELPISHNTIRGLNDHD